MTRTMAAALLTKFLRADDPVGKARWEERVIAAMMFAPADPGAGCPGPGYEAKYFDLAEKYEELSDRYARRVAGEASPATADVIPVAVTAERFATAADLEDLAEGHGLRPGKTPG